LAELFAVDVRTVSEHLKNICESDELERAATLRKSRKGSFLSLLQD